MPRVKKTTEAVAPKTAAKPKTVKTKDRAVSKTTPSPSKDKHQTSGAASKISSIEQRLKETEEKLEALITIMHNDLHRGQLQGPEGLAAKLRKAGLLSS